MKSSKSVEKSLTISVSQNVEEKTCQVAMFFVIKFLKSFPTK